MKDKKENRKKGEKPAKKQGFKPGNQGEGDRESAREYRKDVERHKQTADPEDEAREAKEAVEKDDGGLAEAEEKGKERGAEKEPRVDR